MPPTPTPQPTPLFPPFPPTTIKPIYAWRAYTGANSSITSSIANPRPLSDIPAGVVAMVWYHNPTAPPPGAQIDATRDYGNVRPYTFRMPDGTTRVNATSMNPTAYENLANNVWTNDAYPT